MNSHDILTAEPPPAPVGDPGLSEIARTVALDAEPDLEFNDATLLAAQICDTPMAWLTLVEEKRLWFSSQVGLPGSEIPAENAFCAHTILRSDVLVVPDAPADERFATDPLVTGERKIRFYAGAPLMTADGHPLGTLGVMDLAPRELSLEKRAALQALSRQVVAQLESRRGLAELRQAVTELKKTEGELRSRTAFFEAGMNSASAGVLVIDSTGRKLLQNQRFNEIWKLPQVILDETDDLRQLEWRAGQVKDRERFMERIRYLSAHPDEASRDEIVLTDGTILDRYSSPVVGKEGQRYGRMWTYHDVTERKMANQALGRQETELRVLFDLVPASICFKDTHNNILRANKRYADYFGMTVQEIEGKSTLEVYPEEASNFFAVDSEVIASKTQKLGSISSIMTKEGKEMWLETDLVPLVATDNTVHGIVVMVQDITERVKSEEALRLLSSAMVQAKESIVITDAELDLPGPKIIFTNPAFTAMTGYSAEEALGKTPRILQGSLTDREQLKRLRQSLKNGEIFRGESISYRKDGNTYNQEWQIAPIHDPEGKTTHFVATQRDITERKSLEARLYQSQKMETVGRLAGGVAHEFNSILTAIIGQSEILLSDLPKESTEAQSALEISKAAIRAANLTRQLLAYGRKQQLEPQVLDLRSLLAGMKNTLDHLIGQEADLLFVPSDRLKSVLADARQIEQVIVNIVLNAREAMPDGGKVTLELASLAVNEENAGDYPEMTPGNYVMIAITDTGVGMSQEVKARIFEPFYTTKGVGQGTGLGLSTSYGIIKQSGGHIGVYSEPARGTTFKIYLPEVDEEKPQVPQLDSPAMPRGTETILLAEDDPTLRTMARTFLEKLGYKVFTAANGMEALRMKEQGEIGHVDLLFTDVVMPQMSGQELSERIQALYPQTKILFTSAFTENAFVHQGVLNQGVTLLQKPFTPSILARKLREVLDL